MDKQDVDMEPGSWRSTLRRLALYGGAYAAWIAASALGGLDVFLFRAALNQVYILFHLSPSSFRFVDRSSVFVAGAAWLFLMMLGEGYFVGAVEKNDLRRRVVKVFGVLGLAAGVLYLIPLLLVTLKLA